LVEMQFLDYNVVAKSYRITVKGLKFLQLHEKMCKMLSA
jgi:hypothetical protein